MFKRAFLATLLGVLLSTNGLIAFAQDEGDLEDLEATVEAIESEIDEIIRDSVPNVEEIDQDEFDALIEDVTAGDPAFGPVDGEIVHSQEFIDVRYAQGRYDDFLLRATFEQPYKDDNAQFDFGVEIRVHGDYDNPTRIYLVIDSGGNWYAAYATDEEWSNSEELELGDGRYRRLETDAGTENTLTVIVEGQTLHFGINGDYVSSLGLPIGGPGSLAIGTGFYVDDTVKGEVTPYTDFAVWEI